MTDLDLVVIGGGITGLAAAWEAHRQGADVVVLEASDRPGGKLRTSPVAGIPVDETADAFLARVPEAVELCDELGIGGELVPPSTGKAYIWSQSELRPLPQDQLLGVPTDLEVVASTGILSPEGLARAAQDLARGDGSPTPPDGGAAGPGATSTGGSQGSAGNGDGGDRDGRGRDSDEEVGDLVRRHLGDEVHDRLVAPLIGGIWAGDCDRLSLEVTAPALAEARRQGPSLIRGARAVRAAATADPDRPVFLAPRAGMARLVETLAGKLGDRLRLGQPVERIEKVGAPGTAAAGARWRVEPAGVTADAVVVATPAPMAARLIAPHSTRAAGILAGIDHASVVLVTMAVPRDGIDHPLDGSGFLVPPSAGMLLTACSWTTSKWGHLASPSVGGDVGDTVLLRASAGRDGDDRALKLDDGDLLEALRADLRMTMGLRADPIDVRIGRWPQAFPQPRPGHLSRVALLEEALAEDAPKLVVTGAWARGVGIPACIRSARQAAVAVL